MLKDRDVSISQYSKKMQLIESIIGYQKSVIEINELPIPSKLHRLYQELESISADEGLESKAQANSRNRSQSERSYKNVPQPQNTSSEESLESSQTSIEEEKVSVKHHEIEKLPRLKKDSRAASSHYRSYSNPRSNNNVDSHASSWNTNNHARVREHSRLRQASQASSHVSSHHRRPAHSKQSSTSTLSEDYSTKNKSSRRKIRFNSRDQVY